VLEQIARTGKPADAIAEDIENGSPCQPWVVTPGRRCAQCGCASGPRLSVIAARPCSKTIARFTNGSAESPRDAGLQLENTKLRCSASARRHQPHKTHHHRGEWQRSGRQRARVEQGGKQNATKTEPRTYDKEKPKERHGQSSPVGVAWEGGAATETEMKDKKLRLEECHQAPPSSAV